VTLLQSYEYNRSSQLGLYGRCGQCSVREQVPFRFVRSTFTKSANGTDQPTAVALATLLYDHARTFATEVEDVWVSLRVSTGIKLGFLFGRYASDLTMLYTSYGETLLIMSRHLFLMYQIALSGIAGNMDQAVRIYNQWINL
jgi:hypothetical protein